MIVNTRLSLINRPDLTTERLFLRRPNDRDADAIVCSWRLGGGTRLARVLHPYGPADARFFLNHVVPAEWVWAITVRGTNTLLGAIGLTPEKNLDAAELGYWLSPIHWGNGIMTEAARAIVAFGFESLRLPVLTSGYCEDNSPSGGVLRKLGFHETGRTMRPCLAAGGEMPSITMKLTRPTEG